MFCPNCGNQVPDGSANCPNCGASITNGGSNNFANNPSQNNGYGYNPPPQNNSYGYNPPPQNNSYGYNPPPQNMGQAPMKKERSVGLAIVFTIITCGIYGLYWFVVLTDETNAVSGEVNGTSGGMALLFTIITCGIYSIYWMYKQGEKIDRVKTMRGIPSSNSGVLYLVLSILGLGIVSYALMQSELNKL